MVVFHTWFWERCLVNLRQLLLPGLNKEDLEPVESSFLPSFLPFVLTQSFLCECLVSLLDSEIHFEPVLLR